MVFAGCFHGSVHDLHHIIWDELTLSADFEPRIISLHEFSMLHELRKFCFGQQHQAVNLTLGSVEVFKTEGIDCHSLDTTFVANLQDLMNVSIDHVL